MKSQTPAEESMQGLLFVFFSADVALTAYCYGWGVVPFLRAYSAVGVEVVPAVV
jgi:hypothetical protein